MSETLLRLRLRLGAVWARVQDDRGLAAVVFAMTLPAVLGMCAVVVDGTRLFVERRELQNAADAAALAAAVYLPSSDPVILQRARDEAIAFAALNGFVIDGGDIDFTSDAEVNDRVTVRTSGDVTFTFAKGLGLTVGAVSSRGSAQIGIVGALGGVMPWGVEDPVGGFVFGDSYCLKLGSGGGGGGCDDHAQGNFHALDNDDTGTDSASEYRDRIRYGSNKVVRVGDVKNVASGNMQGPTQQGTGCSGNSGRITGNTQVFEDVIEALSPGYRVLDWTSPRLVVIPVVSFPDSASAVVEGFSVFFIEGCEAGGAVTGRFIDTIVPGGEWAAWDAGAGTRMVRLVE